MIKKYLSWLKGKFLSKQRSYYNVVFLISLFIPFGLFFLFLWLISSNEHSGMSDQMFDFSPKESTELLFFLFCYFYIIVCFIYLGIDLIINLFTQFKNWKVNAFNVFFLLLTTSPYTVPKIKSMMIDSSSRKEADRHLVEREVKFIPFEKKDEKLFYFHEVNDSLYLFTKTLKADSTNEIQLIINDEYNGDRKQKSEVYNGRTRFRKYSVPAQSRPDTEHGVRIQYKGIRIYKLDKMTDVSIMKRLTLLPSFVMVEGYYYDESKKEIKKINPATNDKSEFQKPHNIYYNINLNHTNYYIADARYESVSKHYSGAKSGIEYCDCFSQKLDSFRNESDTNPNFKLLKCAPKSYYFDNKKGNIGNINNYMSFTNDTTIVKYHSHKIDDRSYLYILKLTPNGYTFYKLDISKYLVKIGSYNNIDSYEFSFGRLNNIYIKDNTCYLYGDKGILYFNL